VARIVIDARSAVDARRTGVGHYARALTRHLPRVDPENQYTAWYLDVRGIGSKRRKLTERGSNLAERATRIPTRVFGPVASRLRLPRVEWLTGGFDLFLATNFVPPPTGSRDVVLVVHDLAFEVMPETAPHHQQRWRTRFERWLERAAGIIVPSEAVRDDLLARHDVDAAKVSAIHHGTDADALRPVSPVEVDDVRRRFGIDGPYILFVGGLEPRKNLQGLIRAFGLLQDARVALVVAGGEVPWAQGYGDRIEEAIADLPEAARSRVIRTGYVSDEDRHALLSGAEILAYPSLLEGFGFPILEGFAANVPVLTSSTSSMPEVAGDAAVLVDPTDPASLAEGLDELLGDEDLRNVLRAAGTARVSTFTWEKSARETVAALHGALDLAL
jgi:glycosyltransferase involved in cell wall biosynthesis